MTPFARLHDGPGLLLLPNAWDFASAAALIDAGFPAVGTTSLGVAAGAGLPDGAGETRDGILALAIALGRGGFLFTVDAEDGFGDEPAEVAVLARELWAVGAAGINLEDGLGDPGRHAAKVAAVKAAVPGLFVNARTDTYWLGSRQDETEARLKTYRDAGADGVFVPGITDPAAIEALTTALDIPLNVLHTPTAPTLPQLRDLGVRRVSLGSLLYRRALADAVTTARAIRDGRPPTPAAVPSYDAVQALSAPAPGG